MGRRVGDGEAVKVTVPVSRTIVPGTWYRLDGFIGMAMEAVITNAVTTSKVALEIAEKEYEIAGAAELNTADAFALGDDVYFETTTGLFRSVAHGALAPANGLLIGRVTVPKDPGNAVWFLRTNTTN